MQYISSDTSVWIDFSTIQRVEFPFRLPYKYIMNSDAIRDEILSPPGLGEQLLSCGLEPVEITDDEFMLALEYGSKYVSLSTYDRIALAIAKSRKIILLTGDKRLRNAAKEQGVEIIGTIGILDQLIEAEAITREEYRGCLQELLENNGGAIRLPAAELTKRLQTLLEG